VIEHTIRTVGTGRILRALAICAMVVAASAGSAMADSQYSYQGNLFTDFSVGYSCPPTCALSGSFTLANAIGPDNTVTFITPLTYSFIDGNQTFTPSNSSFMDIGFVTNSSGNIDEWIFEISSNSGNTYVESEAVPGGGDLSGNSSSLAFAANTNPGTWSVVTTPEPSEILLLCVGLIGLVCLRQWKLGQPDGN
jgi:hypothetical protein